VASSISAKKRIRQREMRTAQNRSRRSMLKTLTRRFNDAVKSGDASVADTAYRNLSRRLDQFSTTSTLHKKKAARLKSRLSKRLNELTRSPAA